MNEKFPALMATVFLFIIGAGRGLAAGETVPLRVLTANVGNADVMNCGAKYFYKLCIIEWEEKIAAGIARLSPDIVALQEVLDVKWCAEAGPERDRRKSCYRYDERREPNQVRRLLGPEYTIVCDGRSNFECIGIRKTLGEVEGCEAGALCRGGEGITHDVPDECSPKTVVFGIDVVIKSARVRIVNGHPSAGESDCRAVQIERMFEGYDDVPPLAVVDYPCIIMGDMNMDPFTGDPEKDDVSAWLRHVGDGKDFYYLSGPAEKDPPFRTCSAKTLDHVITNVATGACATLGMSPGTERLDRYPLDRPIQEAPDHFSIFCEIELPAGGAGGE